MRRGVGVNQGRVLGLLVIMDPRPVSGGLLASVAYPSGDLTQGRRVLRALMLRGLIEPDVPGPFQVREGRAQWRATPEGRTAFYIWFRGRIADLEGLPA